MLDYYIDSRSLPLSLPQVWNDTQNDSSVVCSLTVDKNLCVLVIISVRSYVM